MTNKKYFFCNPDVERNFDIERGIINEYGGKYISGIPVDTRLNEGGLEKELKMIEEKE